jgi:hypothetical protein
MEACKECLSGQHYLYPIGQKTDRPIALVNIVSRTYTARLAKERLEGQQL